MIIEYQAPGLTKNKKIKKRYIFNLKWNLKSKHDLYDVGGYSSVVERSLRMWEASGSIPDISTKLFHENILFPGFSQNFFFVTFIHNQLSRITI